MSRSDTSSSAESTPLCYFDRRLGVVCEEAVYGEKPLRWLYRSRLGRFLAHSVLARPWMSRLAGRWYSRPASRRRIPSFVDEFKIDLSEYESGEWRCFNDFFIRRFRNGSRPFTTSPDELPAFAEGRYLAWDRVGPDVRLPVKGEHLRASALLGGVVDPRPFEDGAVFIARLCPVDYHRFHYPDSGRTLGSWEIPGRLHSVNPWALSARGDILATNRRRVSILETESFGRLAYIEVGAMNVGTIVQTHDEEQPFRRGDEKGYFLFGGSTVVLLAEPGRLVPDPDIAERTARNLETLCRLGERIATRRAASGSV